MKPLRKLAFVVNEEKPGAPELARELIAITRRAGLALNQTPRCPLPHGWLPGHADAPLVVPHRRGGRCRVRLFLPALAGRQAQGHSHQAPPRHAQVLEFPLQTW